MQTSDHKPDSIAAAAQRRKEGHDDGPMSPADEATPSTAQQLLSHPAGAMAGAATGAAAGLVAGIAAGPVGSLAGAVVGGATGAVVGAGSSSAAGGNPVQPAALDGEAAAAAPSLQGPSSAGAPDNNYELNERNRQAKDDATP